MSDRKTDKMIDIAAQGAGLRNDLTGNRSFNPDAVMEMMVYLSSQNGGVLKTKLNKEMFYADFTHFRDNSVSISGATYVHWPFGPVVDQYELYLLQLASEESIRIEEYDYGNGYIGENIIACRPPEMAILPKSAVVFLDAVVKAFARFGSKEISEVSHREKAYIETEKFKPIPYTFAKELAFDIFEGR
jgi:hypothetical protein